MIYSVEEDGGLGMTNKMYGSAIRAILSGVVVVGLSLLLGVHVDVYPCKVYNYIAVLWLMIGPC